MIEYVFGLRISNMLQFQIIFNEIIQTFLRSVSSGHMYHLNFKLQYGKYENYVKSYKDFGKDSTSQILCSCCYDMIT